MLLGMEKQTHDFKGFDDYIEVFKAGTQTDSKGRSRTFSIADLDEVVANVSASNPVPHVITHKEMYSPFAYAQTTRVKREGNSLYVKADKVEPQFEKLVADGRLFERSVRLVPTDKGWTLGHVAWLGAQPPAVEGLAPVEFGSADGNFYDFVSDSYTPSMVSRGMRRMRDFFIEHFGVEEADRVLPGYEIESLADHANTLRDNDNADNDTALFSKHTPTPKPTGDDMSEFTQAQMDAAIKKATDAAKQNAEADFAAKQQTTADALKAEKGKRLMAEFNADISALVDTGHLLPAQTEGMAEFRCQLEDDTDVTFEFAAGEPGKQETIKKSASAWFNDFTKSIGPQVSLGEQADKDIAASSSSDFSVPNAEVNPERLALHNKAVDYMAAHPNVDYVLAVQMIEKKEG